MYQPIYQITNELLNKITHIEKLHTQIKSSHILPERELEMRYRATVEAAHSSTSIEGNPLTIKQVDQVLSNKKPLTRHQYAEIEVRNYSQALAFIDKRKTTNKKLRVKDILDIHKIVAQDLLENEKTGFWRTNPVYIEDHHGKAVYSGALPKIVPQEVEKLLQWLNTQASELHPIIAAAILHFQFISIHPFADGNGRTTRLLTSLYLGLRHYDFRSSLVLDSYYAADRKEYYHALQTVSGNNYNIAKKAELSSWINYFTNGFLSSATVLASEVTLITRFSADMAVMRKISRDGTDLLSYIQQFGSITLSEATSVLPNVPRRTVQRRLKELIDSGYIRSEGMTNNIRYVKAK